MQLQASLSADEKPHDYREMCHFTALGGNLWPTIWIGGWWIVWTARFILSLQEVDGSAHGEGVDR
ncbi:hypothetical protein JAAARDRAFT_37749 [Jaapia argillacea MUCL 33604]|uniref:Uncharacterized protein n=1 Tax=Jaapia argillacea MUCL 33604 TaxID=933084 RepID=A0A067PN42_9AGAM|nr:hypothetical protein JAAARDRAFT_37749 [Jaapia argillacea MUCL 33604]